MYNYPPDQVNTAYSNNSNQAKNPNPYQTTNNNPISYNLNQYSDNPYGNTQKQYATMQYQQKPIQAPDTLKHLQDGLQGQARKAFIKKVYAILSIQLLITVALCFVSFYVRPFLQFQYYNQWIMWVLFIVMIVIEVVIFCLPAGRRHPVNLILLFLFTLCQSYVISFICSLVAMQNGSQVVIVAACMTLAIVIGLTAYAIFTPTDFSVKGGIMILCLIALIMFGIFCAWTPVLNNLYCCLGVIVFGIYLVIDTQLIIGGRRLAISMDDYVVGALILYMDIIQIFLYLLQLFGRR